ncbi:MULTISPECIES: hypothetical protein [Mesorhizobium]|uniref:Uncharacterized protein n=2 Tax=Mesorhizobium TaxID=68287 RepID=A0A1A5ICQ6_RHILI|nr:MULTISPECIES: hypothetical protein [Mesorhizobium]ETA72662.1 hypothetical protein MesloDRAFT_1542 [Mesorhizobium japonicum R7A]MBE1711165.1 hypothetical protein [Mesorhizobium japonicum]MBE1714658.1 hypothetical protein [Mesorhizobium japonicum]MUT22269.1 hypothetical protein [Mesorhizobium japonicum]MUT28310.1 hypothetical protein [Mesorhizobium japonicum]
MSSVGSRVIKIDDVWSAQLRFIVPLEDADDRRKRWIGDARRPGVALEGTPARPDTQKFRFILTRQGRDYRSYETAAELMEGCRRYLSTKKLDQLATQVAGILRNEFVEERFLEPETKGTPHWL